MRIGITGGSGFIGTQLCHILHKLGHELVIIDIAPSNAFPNARKNINVCDLPSLTKALKGCEVIFHLAAEHRDDVQPIEKYYDVNVEGGKNVALAARANGINRIIFTSTVAVYGLDKDASKETDIPDPFNDYGRSKLYSEKTFQEWANGDPARCLIVLRLVATFGVGNRGNIYNLLNTIAKGKFAMIGSGKNRKSIAYVGNVAAFLAHTLTLDDGVHVYNYADKPDLNMMEMVTRVCSTLGREMPPKIPYTVGMIGGYIFDIISKITRHRFPFSSIRIKKFCADTIVNADKLKKTHFKAPHSLLEGLDEMINREFVKKV